MIICGTEPSPCHGNETHILLVRSSQMASLNIGEAGKYSPTVVQHLVNSWLVCHRNSVIGRIHIWKYWMLLYNKKTYYVVNPDCSFCLKISLYLILI